MVNKNDIDRIKKSLQSNKPANSENVFKGNSLCFNIGGKEYFVGFMADGRIVTNIPDSYLRIGTHSTSNGGWASCEYEMLEDVIVEEGSSFPSLT